MKKGHESFDEYIKFFFYSLQQTSGKRKARTEARTMARMVREIKERTMGRTEVRMERTDGRVVLVRT